ncbi:Short-chain dehydrogenase TIC 32, chloroplastic [Cytospora mali]|uniref:Short-chain dehydrogenase TIC 32, chloroplastic n=1 Tax=Cytospora mali TaxID=578113 RepID=A0A194V754_CYTMA|nr:Short-chain dehydrogenase TIC 32, chloroplastic [Valsa mali var. pyri (nom. inval.)]
MNQSKSSKGTILGTGTNGTVGSEILAAYHGIYTVRNTEKAPVLELALRCGKQSQEHSHNVISLDLADLHRVRAVAGKINQQVADGEIPPIRALILNAGYLEFTTQSWTADGFDMSFACNYLGHWLLALLLLQSMNREEGRIVVVGSESHDPHNSKSKAAFNQEKYMNFIHDVYGSEPVAKGTWSSSKEDPSFHSGFRRYGASKFCQALMIPELQRRLDTDPALQKLCILGVDPGSMPGNLTRRGPWIIRVFMFKLVMPWLAPLIAWLQPNGPLSTAKMGAADIIAAALWRGEKGMYFYRSKPSEMSPEAKDEKKRGRLWVDTVRYTHLKAGESVLANWQ